MAALNRVERAHQMYRDGRHEEALLFYTEALAIAKTKAQKIALHSNRAACYLKLHDLKKAADECTSVLELDYNHTGALMLRAQTLVSLKEYNSALFDVNRLMEAHPTSEVYQDLQARLKTQLSLAPIPESEAELEEEEGNEVQSEIMQEEENDHAVEENKIEKDHKVYLERTATACSNVLPPQTQSCNKFIEEPSKGWQSIPKPKGHTNLDYSRWDRVEDDSSEDDDDEEEEDDENSQPHYRFRLRTVNVRPVK